MRVVPALTKLICRRRVVQTGSRLSGAHHDSRSPVQERLKHSGCRLQTLDMGMLPVAQGLGARGTGGGRPGPHVAFLSAGQLPSRLLSAKM